MLNVCVSASDSDYCTCAEAMFVLFGSTTTANVATTQEIQQISRLVRAASRQADAYVGYTLGLQAYSESVAAYDGRRLMLAVSPLVKVLRMFDSTATCDATAFCSTDYSVDSYDAAILAREAGFAWTADWARGATNFHLGLTPTPIPGRESKPWLVEYVSGYRVAASTTTCHGLSTGDENWTTGQTLPEDITQAVAARAARLYSNPLDLVERRVADLGLRFRVSRDGRSRWPELDAYARSA